MNINAAFQWQRHPEAEQLLMSLVDQAAKQLPAIRILEQQLLEQTSTRLFDWLDHVVVPDKPELQQQLQKLGFVEQAGNDFKKSYHHPGAQFPRVILNRQPQQGIAVSVDRIADFLMVRGTAHGVIEGFPLSGYRRCLVEENQGTCLWVVERRGDVSLEPQVEEPSNTRRYLEMMETWQARQRSIDDEDQAMQQAIDLAEKLVEQVGQNRAAWIVLECERMYWQSRNLAGQIQKNRQDRLGMGWANHDHHTFRSSRRLFTRLVYLFEKLGFQCRERFYAGEEAGWGAQVMENPACRLVLFLDVDLAPGEIAGDFAHQPLPALPQLGTIGLWCALHGDSILKSGMHHLEAQFLFDNLAHDLDRMGVKMMDPFSSFSYLRQAFTHGENWPVDVKRIDKLIRDGQLTDEQAQKFKTHGAIGSHLENLQRREGYKGFNQKNVSIIIKKTDPRYVQD